MLGTAVKLSALELVDKVDKVDKVEEEVVIKEGVINEGGL